MSIKIRFMYESPDSCFSVNLLDEQGCTCFESIFCYLSTTLVFIIVIQISDDPEIFYSWKSMALHKMTLDYLLVRLKDLKVNLKRQEQHKTSLVPGTDEPNTATEICNFF